MPKISIVVPVYKVESYIHRCIRSILMQSFTDYDLILVDDGSPDRCGKICDEYAKMDSRIIVIHKKNGGLSDARNAGIEWALTNSNSEWITFIDSDDWVHYTYLESLYHAAVSTGIPIALVRFERTTGYDLVVDNNKVVFNIIKTKDLYRNYYKHFITAWGKLYRKADFKNIRYPKGKLHEDEFTTWKILFMYPEIVMIDATLYAYFINDTGITQSNWNLHRVDGLEAQNERLVAIENNPNYNDFLEKTIIMVAHTIAGYIQTLDNMDGLDSDKYIPGFRKELRQFLKKYRKKLPIKKYGWLYENAYPLLMSIRMFVTETRDKLYFRLSIK